MDLRPRYLMWVNFFMFVFGFSIVFAGAYTWAESQAAQGHEARETNTWETRLERSDPDVRNKSLAAAVDTALKLEPGLAGFPVAVTAHNMIIYLQGQVATRAQKAQAGEAAGRTPGVAGVGNHLSVKPGLKPQPQAPGEQRADSAD